MRYRKLNDAALAEALRILAARQGGPTGSRFITGSWTKRTEVVRIENLGTFAIDVEVQREGGRPSGRGRYYVPPDPRDEQLPNSKVELQVAPGWRARELLTFIYSKRTRAHVFDQIMADMQEEWMEAMVAGNIRHAKWIRLRGYAALLLGAIAHAVALAGAKVRDIWRVI